MRTLVVMLAMVASVHAGLDIGVDTISGIPGTVDSGLTMVPGPVLSTTTGGGPGQVYLEILQRGLPIHRDSGEFPSLNPGAKCTLALSGWDPAARESLEAVAWLRCTGDTYPSNDTCRQRFFVRVKDVGVTQIIMPPPDTVLDSGVVFSPRCRVWNFGNVAATFDVRFRIGAYQSTENTILIPGGSRVVTAPDHCTATPGIWSCQVSAVLVGDRHPDNNVMIDTFTVRGNITADVAARAVLAPPGVVDTTMTVTPKGRFANRGTSEASFWAYFSIRRSDGAEIYAESSQAVLGPGDSTDIEYASIRFPELGTYTAICSTAMPGDQNSTNDVVHKSFRVVDRITGDVGMTFVVMPSDTVDTLTTFGPRVKLKNYGTEVCSVCVFLVFSDTVQDRVVYRDSVYMLLPGGGEIQGDFDSVRFTVLGLHEGLCWFEFAYDRPDTLGWQFWVVPFVPGVEEGTQLQTSSSKPQATIVRSMLFVSEAMSGERLAVCAQLLDIAGRKVQALRPGPNDVSDVSPGVYFVREASGVGKASSVRKVVLTD